LSFLGELKRRNVFRVAGVYAVVGWLLVQVAASLEEAIGLPAWFDGLVVALLAIGFPIGLIFAWAFELTPEGIKRTAAVDADESITAQTGSKLDIVLVLALLVFAGAMLLPKFMNTQQLPGLVTGSSAAAASIAVLPFADLSPDSDQEYFADGISEELLNVLAKVNGLKVAGRTSSFAFKGRNEDLREIGRVLDVAHILEGSVRSQGDKVRVTAQLIQVSDGFHLWSETYDGDLNDIFAVQDDIASRILLAMKNQLNVEEAPVVAPVQRADVTAYGRFLEARDLIFTREPSKMERAMALLDEAIAIDPGYAPAYASRAKALLLLSDRPGSYGTIPAQEAMPRAEADVEKALELDPDLADAYAVRGLINSDSGRVDYAIINLRRAIELSPNSLDARNWLALALANETVPESAANSLDNSGLRFAYYGLGVVDEYSGTADLLPVWRPRGKYVHGDKEGALRMAREAVEESPDFYVAHAVYIGLLSDLRRDQQLVDYFQREYVGRLETYAVRLRPGVNAEPPPYLELALALRTVGEQRLFDEAMQRMRFSIDIFRAGGDVSVNLDRTDAAYWAIAGDNDKALSFLERAFEKASLLNIFFAIDRAYESLQEEPRFLALRERNLARINEERAILGYEPLTLAFYERFAPPE
jgi:TolB-like protein